MMQGDRLDWQLCNEAGLVYQVKSPALLFQALSKRGSKPGSR
jgi:hypothetical protein